MQLKFRYQAQKIISATKNNKVIFAGLMLAVSGSLMNLGSVAAAPYAHASDESDEEILEIKSPLFDQQASLFEGRQLAEGRNFSEDKRLENSVKLDSKMTADALAEKLYAIVGDAPIREMVPFIAQRDEKVAAFLVGIAKKESSFGAASPSKDGKTCYNYWGYKGQAGRGTGMGYACFASAEEAVETVGDRIEALVNKNRSTPAKMVDTWKCGTSCAGDPGAPGWVSTVALYFDKIVDQNS